MVPPPFAKLSISSRSGGNPSSWIDSANPLVASRTPSMLRKTSVSLPEPSAAFASTKPTVARSVSSLLCVRFTQNFAAITQPPCGSAILAANAVHRRLRRQQRVSCEPAPGRHILGGTRVVCDETQHLTRPHRFHASAQPQQQDAARKILGVPDDVGVLHATRSASRAHRGAAAPT